MSKAFKSERSKPHSTARLKNQDAIHSLRLEGIELPKETLEDIALFEEGKITKEEVLKRLLARSKR